MNHMAEIQRLPSERIWINYTLRYIKNELEKAEVPCHLDAAIRVLEIFPEPGQRWVLANDGTLTTPTQLAGIQLSENNPDACWTWLRRHLYGRPDISHADLRRGLWKPQ